MAPTLLEGKKTEVVIADKGYDSDEIRAVIRKLEAEPVIPYRSNRKNAGLLDSILYGARHAIENFFNKVKHYRSIACRYDKTATSYCAMITLACILTWARLCKHDLEKNKKISYFPYRFTIRGLKWIII